MSTIALKIGITISDKDCGAISTIETNAESGYYPVKLTSESFTLQSSRKLVNGVFKAGELLCDAAYLNPLANFKQLYTPYQDENEIKTTVRLDTVILTSPNWNQ